MRRRARAGGGRAARAGRQATTHWVYEPVFRKFFPDVTLHIERVLVQNGPGHNLVCGGGASSWQDLALLLVAKYGGTEEAIRMSKLFLYQWHRDGQLPYASMMQNVDHGDGVILKCQEWIAQHYQRQDIIAELVRRSGLPKRRSTAASAPRPATRRWPMCRRCASRKQSSFSRPAACRSSRSGARSATRTPPRSDGCSGVSSASDRATTGANSSRRPSSLRWLSAPARARRSPRAHISFIPAQAGIQGQDEVPALRGDERGQSDPITS